MKHPTANEVNILAAMFARSNMGMELNGVEPIVKNLKASKTQLTIGSTVLALCDSFLESDEQYDWFIEEAYSWVKDLNNAEKMARSRSIHKDIFEIYDRA